MPLVRSASLSQLDSRSRAGLPSSESVGAETNMASIVRVSISAETLFTYAFRKLDSVNALLSGNYTEIHSRTMRVFLFQRRLGTNGEEKGSFFFNPDVLHEKPSCFMEEPNSYPEVNWRYLHSQN